MILASNDAVALSLLSGVSGALIVVIVALGVALAKTREQITKALEWQRIHEDWHKTKNGDKL